MVTKASGSLRLKLCVWLLGGAVLVLAATAMAGEPAPKGLPRKKPPISSDLEAAGWMLLTLPGKAVTRFSGRDDGAIQVVADDSVAFLYKPVPAAHGDKHRLAWRWRVDQSTPPSDLSEKGLDDRPLALHLGFPNDGEPTSFWQGVGRALMPNFYQPLSGKVISYVWGGTQARGTKLANPHLASKGVMIVLRPGDETTGRWFTEEIGYGADFEMAFGHGPPPLTYLAISADSDDRTGRMSAVIADIRLRG